MSSVEECLGILSDRLCEVETRLINRLDKIEECDLPTIREQLAHVVRRAERYYGRIAQLQVELANMENKTTALLEEIAKLKRGTGQ